MEAVSTRTAKSKEPVTNTTEHHPLWASPFFKQCSIEFWIFLTAGLTLLNIVCTLKTCQFRLFWPCVAAGSLNALSKVIRLVNPVAIGRSLLSFLTSVVYMFSLFFLVSLTILIFINLFKEPAFDSIHFLYCFFCFQFLPSVCYTNFAFFFLVSWGGRFDDRFETFFLFQHAHLILWSFL